MAATYQQAQPATTNLGTLIQHFRRLRRLSQSDLARLSGVDRSLMSRIESGERSGSRESINAIANALDLGEVDRAVLFSHAGLIERPIDELRAMQLCDYWWRTVTSPRDNGGANDERRTNPENCL